MRDLTYAELAVQDAHVALALGLIKPEQNFCCHHFATCTCGQRFCADCGIQQCERCRLRSDIVNTLKLEFGIEIDERTADEGAQVYNRGNLAPFVRWISKIHPLAPLAYTPMVA